VNGARSKGEEKQLTASARESSGAEAGLLGLRDWFSMHTPQMSLASPVQRGSPSNYYHPSFPPALSRSPHQFATSRNGRIGTGPSSLVYCSRFRDSRHPDGCGKNAGDYILYLLPTARCKAKQSVVTPSSDFSDQIAPSASLSASRSLELRAEEQARRHLDVSARCIEQLERLVFVHPQRNEIQYRRFGMPPA
jgi:hypothetical protein